jgi:imidazolonepropionase
MKADLIIRSNYIFTSSEKRDPEILDGYVAAENGKISAVGGGEAPRDLFGGDTRYIDARGKTVTPGLIDAHTHLIHGGSREKELSLKLRGVPYLEILKMGGGILSTVESTRAASKEELKKKAMKSLKQMLLHGTTTIEAKSGYGLDLETEVKCLQAAAELDREGEIDIVRTYMGAHAVPEEYKRDKQGYIDLMTGRVMPYVAESKLAEFMDVFCEEGVFSPEESRQLMQAGKKLGFKLRIHADEIVPLQGAELAAEMGALTAEHLLAASEEGIDAMSRAGTMAVLLPGTSFYLMTGKYAKARRMMEKGIRVALATDYNPGSCPTENLQAVMLFACLGMKLLPEEIIRCMTINAAYAVDRAAETGSIEAGKKADLVIFDAPNLDYLIYHFGINHAETVIKNGKVAVENGNLAKESGYGTID